MPKWIPLFVTVLAVSGCSCGGAVSTDRCIRGTDCTSGLCVDGLCRPASDAGAVRDGAPIVPDAAADAGDLPTLDAALPCDSGISCSGACCGRGTRCAYDRCVIDLGPCATNDDCAGDSYCDSAMRCTPYGVPSDVTNDPACARPIAVGAFAPDKQCEWTGTLDGSAWQTWNQVYSAPMVADFDLDGDPNVVAPSIVVTTFAAPMSGGVLRLLDGRTCMEQTRADGAGDLQIYASNNAIGDLDGAPDGRPEIVGTSLSAAATAGGLVAFKLDPTTRRLTRLWYGRRCDLPNQPRHLTNEWPNNNGPSIHDLDDDGRPEVVYQTHVYDRDGCLLNPASTYRNYLRLGTFAVVADVDADMLPELVTATGVYAWNTTMRDWVIEPYWQPPAADRAEVMLEGHVAVADLGDFPGAVGDAPGRAEIVVASAPSDAATSSETGRVRVMTVGGDIVFGPYVLPSEPGRIAGRGGPPTIGNFDADPRREFAVAGGSRYTVFDLDDTTDGILWSRPSQDESSNVTGSSVFDFDADGVAEVVYADECFVRIYRGTDGEVLFSGSASSGTGYELPVIADVDGDFNSEIVVALTPFTGCPATDPIFTRGTSTFVSSTGVVVYRDAQDRWAASRPIWNQHAYSVTNVNDDGTIPRTSQWMRNSADARLNHFRMNAQGGLEQRGAADLTVAVANAEGLCSASGMTTLRANVCNRGTNPVPDGARVVFYAGDPAMSAAIACESRLPRLLDPSMCTEVSCAYTIPAGASATDLVVVVDPDSTVFECRNGNNRGVIPAASCGLF